MQNRKVIMKKLFLLLLGIASIPDPVYEWIEAQ